ncbi:uncharacterized protein LOC128791558 [Vidua chalybeata]|uniref:uncharacterized protein LOC128791558 n=1 Tax=Vidua chalybeata TaxID=81927 RepID=UPI0023A83618|nr:uncharacterized protein LOC128791558 [Vidua chalybeata]
MTKQLHVWANSSIRQGIQASGKSFKAILIHFGESWHWKPKGACTPQCVTSSPATRAAVRACPSQAAPPASLQSPQATPEGEREKEGQGEGSGSIAEIQQLWPFPESWERLEAERVPSPSISSTDSSSSPGALPGPCPRRRTKQGRGGEERPGLGGAGPCVRKGKISGFSILYEILCVGERKGGGFYMKLSGVACTASTKASIVSGGPLLFGFVLIP